MVTEKRYLLLVSCSARKRHDIELMPALERYDGGTFRVLRKARREGRLPNALDVLILSAKFGVVDASMLIPWYEQRMTPAQCNKLRTNAMNAIIVAANSHRYDHVYIDVGKTYLPAVADCERLFPNMPLVEYAQGRIGERLAHLRQWLSAING